MPSIASPSVSTFDASLRRGALAVILIVAVVGATGYLAAGSLRRIRGGPAGGVLATKATMRTVVTGLQGFRADRGVYPESLQPLVSERFVQAAPLDAWGRPLVYAVPGPAGRDFGLLSLGADGVRGTDDDVDWWRTDSEDGP